MDQISIDWHLQEVREIAGVREIHLRSVQDIRDLFVALEEQRMASGGLPYEPDRLGFNVLG